MRQWKIAVEIGKINRDNGKQTLSVYAFLKMVALGGSATAPPRSDHQAEA